MDLIESWASIIKYLLSFISTNIPHQYASGIGYFLFSGIKAKHLVYLHEQGAREGQRLKCLMHVHLFVRLMAHQHFFPFSLEK